MWMGTGSLLSQTGFHAVVVVWRGFVLVNNTAVNNFSTCTIGEVRACGLVAMELSCSSDSVLRIGCGGMP
jgi:predicted alpha/beta-fold hydrolase